jgi:hypothetical protein
VRLILDATSYRWASLPPTTHEPGRSVRVLLSWVNFLQVLRLDYCRMRCGFGWCALSDLAGPLDTLSPFLVAAVVALVLACLWGDVSKALHHRPARPGQEQVQDVEDEDLRPYQDSRSEDARPFDPAKAKWHSTQPRN